jgi:hypothetical protein
VTNVNETPVFSVTTPGTYVLNGMGGADVLNGGANKDFLWVQGAVRSTTDPWGAVSSPEGTEAWGYLGDDVFRFYTNQSSPWSAATVSLNGGEGTDTLAIHGEWGLDWNISPISLASVENLALAWYPHASALTVRMTGQQYASFSNIYVEYSNRETLLNVIVDGVQKAAEELSEKRVVLGDSTTTWSTTLDYPSDAVALLGTGQSGEVISVPTLSLASIAENSTGTVYTALATDPDAGTTLTYALSGTDSSLFNIDSSTGAVSFKSAPNYEAPADAGGNNVYDITVSASDGVNTSAEQAVAITVTDVQESTPLLAGQSVIDLGSYGKLIAPVQVDGGKWYYFWDRSGDGSTADTGNLNGGVDYTNHDVLDGIFTQDINGVVGGVGDTTDTYRYATLNGVRVALPTVGGVTSPPYGGGGISNYQPGTAIGSSPSTEGSNAVNVDYNDYLAIWDAYNGSGAGSANLDGAPPGWLSAGYWASTPTSVGHAGFAMFTGYIGNGSDDTPIYAALQVL